MFTWCRKRKADVIFLQETHSKEDSEKQWANEWGGKAFFSHGSPNSCGVAILIRNNFNCVIQKSIVDPQGRFIILKADIQDKVYILVNIYAPNKDKVSGKFYKNLHRVLQTEDLDCEENIIIGGDFNCPLDPKLDKKGGVMVPRKMVIDNIECLQNELDLVDVWRIKNPQSRSYTCSQKSPPIFCRLDYWLIPTVSLLILSSRSKTSSSKFLFFNFRLSCFKRRVLNCCSSTRSCVIFVLFGLHFPSDSCTTIQDFSCSTSSADTAMADCGCSLTSETRITSLRPLLCSSTD